MSKTILVVINKDDKYLEPSETFLHAHINGLPCNVITLIGNPGFRYLIADKRYLSSRALLPLTLRWLNRQLGLSSVTQQDRRALRHYLKRFKIDAVLAEYGPSAVSVMDACKDVKIPLIAHFHGYDAYRETLLKTYANGYRKLFDYASAIVVVSQHMRNQIIKLGADPDKIFHNACGADIPKKQKAAPEKSAKRFLMVGRLVEKKAPFLSIMAFSQVVSQHQDATLEIIGDGHLKYACEQLCKSIGISDKVNFLGALPHEKVFEHMGYARCFIQHSVRAPDGDNEGTPVGVQEAMGMGLPVVTTRHGGILDIIENNINGSLVDEYDISAMAHEMKRYADDAMHAKRIGDNARKSVLMNATSKISVERLWDIIEKQAFTR